MFIHAGRERSTAPTLTLQGDKSAAVSEPARDNRLHQAIVGASMALHLAHQWWYREWTIDDAAISYAYARNLVDGWGLVPFPGGERIEGYSNPLWVACIAVWEVLGIDGFTSAKWMVAVLGSATIYLVWKLARKALPEDDGPGALIAPLALGVSAHHAIWAASCLENSLFTFLVVGGILALLTDLESDRWPRSPLWFLGVGLTRPEGILYAALAGGWWAIWCVADGKGWRKILAWAGIYWVPYGAFLAWRVWYFAWPLPNTYYAKVLSQGSFPLRWYARGWEQIRDFADRLWTGFFLPIYALGLIGFTGWRRWAYGVVFAVFAVLLLIPGPDWLKALSFWPQLEDPIWWIRTRVIAIGIGALLIPALALGRPGGRARALTWTMAAAAVFFSVYSNGDWMDGLRWMSLFAPQTAVLLAVGVVEGMRVASRWVGQPTWGRVGWALAAAGLLLQVPPNVEFSRWYRPIWDDYPEMIFPRVQHSEAFARKVFLDEPLVPLDMDMGAHLMWSEQRPVDMAGLVDIPMSHHHYDQRAFISDYVFGEKRPHVAHVHSRWAEMSGYRTYDEWKRDYFHYAGYADGKWFHDGLFGRKDLVMNDASVDPDDVVGFARGVTLRGLDLPSPEAGAGRSLYVDTAWDTTFQRSEDDPFSVTMFVHRDGRVHSWDLPMGYTMSGYPAYPVDEWKPQEVFRGQYAVRLPRNLPPGDWDLGFVVRGAKGYVLKAGGIEAEPRPVAAGAVIGGRDAPPVVAHGEVRFPGVVRVVSAAQAVAEADADRIAALEAAWGGRCRNAEDQWRLARRHVPLDEDWEDAHEPEIAEALASCWAERATEDEDLAAIRLARAHRWSPGNADLLRIKEPVADRLIEEAHAARARQDWEVAYARFRDALSFAPERSWARRYAEEARDHRLGLD